MQINTRIRWRRGYLSFSSALATSSERHLLKSMMREKKSMERQRCVFFVFFSVSNSLLTVLRMNPHRWVNEFLVDFVANGSHQRVQSIDLALSHRVSYYYYFFNWNNASIRCVTIVQRTSESAFVLYIFDQQSWPDLITKFSSLSLPRRWHSRSIRWKATANAHTP